MQKIKDLCIKYKELILYILFGFGTTFVSWGTYGLFVGIMHMSVEVGNVLSWIFAVLFAFVTNKVWVFDSRSWNIKIAGPEFLSFLSARLLTGAIEIFGVPFLVRIGLNQTIFGVEGMIAKILMSFFVMAFNYVFSKLLIFKNKEPKEEQKETSDEDKLIKEISHQLAEETQVNLDDNAALKQEIENMKK